MPGKRVQIDDDMWASLNTLAKDRMMSFQELFDEGMRDLLKKDGIPASLKEALSKSAARHEAKERRKSQKRQRRAT
jgi:hypothetical protein